nr:MAG TPA: terminase small subunit [Caudoviricetes sp.]
MRERLTDEQIKKRDWLIEQMNDFKEIDLPLVESLAFAIDRLEYMDERLNTLPAMLDDRQFMSSRDKFVKQVENGLKMLDITPQARNKAKIEAVKEIDPLTELLGDL